MICLAVAGAEFTRQITTLRRSPFLHSEINCQRRRNPLTPVFPTACIRQVLHGSTGAGATLLN